MALLLSIETSTPVCSVALHDHGELVSSREIRTPQAAASQLTPLIDFLFRESGLDKTRLAGVAVSGGPGSYTGLRIGSSTAKGICYALDIPLIALDSLHVLASSSEPPVSHGLICPMIDARRMEVYTCLLTPTLEVIEATRPLVIDENSFQEVLRQSPVTFLGNGADKCEGVIQHVHATFLKGQHPRAARMGRLAFRSFESGTFEDVRLFEPAYLKEFVAKTKKA
ncbi:MAG: tRNA (adenosine(37)-N6)-threonylcarbamoyltransferase complex dimerization subunit type 1 TsaB [Cyclobacteriaceae bacterium]|nr:tRNA (adenosine(37)-N6)-threonylcarbamoyltransferase complex dimerization subunit type 1 TsaB [Cyclobacteriaceae bacterium]